MRSSKRIKPFLKWLEEEWSASQDQRFGQLLINLGLVEDSLKTWNAEISDYHIPFEYLREIQTWGIIKGNILESSIVGGEPYFYYLPVYDNKPICDLDTDHIENILNTQHQISPNLRQIFIMELEWRLCCDEQGFRY